MGDEPDRAAAEEVYSWNQSRWNRKRWLVWIVGIFVTWRLASAATSFGWIWALVVAVGGIGIILWMRRRDEQARQSRGPGVEREVEEEKEV